MSKRSPKARKKAPLAGREIDRRREQSLGTAPAVSWAEHTDGYLPARAVWERYGVSEMSLYRWISDPKMDFPPPYYFGRFRYWKIADLIAWERKRAPARAA
jgi:predicted DNA-binding transcriptional regulator AlpA